MLATLRQTRSNVILEVPEGQNLKWGLRKLAGDSWTYLLSHSPGDSWIPPILGQARYPGLGIHRRKNGPRIYPYGAPFGKILTQGKSQHIFYRSCLWLTLALLFLEPVASCMPHLVL